MSKLNLGGAAPFDFAPFDKLRIYDRTGEIGEGDVGNTTGKRMPSRKRRDATLREKVEM